MKRVTLSNASFALLLALVYTLVAGFVVSRHEIWRDEAQTFLMAKDSRSVPELLHRVKNDIHPPLWHLVLFSLTRVTSSPAAMQVLHLAIAAAAVFLFARFAPFSRLNKILFAAGYYALFEYGVIARNYALGVLFLFLFCVFYPRRRERFLLLGASVALLALTSMQALILAVALTLALAAERFPGGRASAPRLFLPGLGLALAGIAASVLAALPNPESIYAVRVRFVFDAELILPVLRTIPKAFFPLPIPQFHFWNTSLITYLPAPHITLHLLAALILLYSLFLFSRHRPALITFALATSALAAFSYFNYFGYLRHHGFYFLVFLSALWMTSSAAAPAPGSRRDGRLAWLTAACRRAAPAALTFILAIQALAGAYASARDIRDPFSRGRAVADFLQKRGWEDRVLVGDIDYVMSSISVHLGRPIYLSRSQRWGTYQLNVYPPRRATDMNHIAADAERLSRERGKNFLLILNYPLDRRSLTSRSLSLVGKTGKAIVEDEAFYIYRKFGDAARSR
ncbi:MAG: hypothetical protein FJY83_00420 [Candidatus Aminicenantes bacterium]|nr:hypothetical protein [Candidatus Aminicenantes bacterium]